MRSRVATSDTRSLAALPDAPSTVTHIVATAAGRQFCNGRHHDLVTLPLAELSKPEVLSAVELCEQCLFTAITTEEHDVDLAVTVLRRSVLQYDRG
jgi:hypothetical protein